MKKYTFLLLFPLLFSCANSEIIEEWDDGTIKIERYRVDRSRDFEIHYYANGNKKEEGYMSGRKRVSEWKGWHTNGSLKFEMSYKAGKPFSDYATYYENGRLKKKGTYDENELLDGGEVEEYYSNGCLKKMGSRENGKWETWHSCDILESVSYYKNGVMDSLSIIYWDTGGMRTKVNYEDGMQHGKYIEWYENGEVAEEGMYKDGEKIGEWREYWSSGKKKSIGKYRNNIKDGKWLSWYDDDRKQKIEFWRRGELELMNYWDYEGKTLVKNGNGKVPSELSSGDYDHYRNRVIIPVKQ